MPGVLAALGSVLAGILHSCSGFGGFRPWLLAAAPTGEAIKARDRRVTPAAAARRFIQRTKVQRPGAAAAPRLDSPPARPSQAWAWRFFCLKEASHHTVRVASHARGHAWHSFYSLIFSILAMRLPSRLDKRHANIWFCRSWEKKLCFFAKPGLSEFRAVSAQKERFGLQYKGSRLKK